MRPGDDERRCSRCGSAGLRDGAETLSLELPRSAVTATTEVPARRCASCDAPHVDGAVRERFQLAACRALADAGVRTGEAFRQMRKTLGLRAAELAALLDVRPETISHWETGKCAPSRAAFVALCAMVQDALDGRTTTRDRLRALAGDRPYPRALRVELK